MNIMNGFIYLFIILMVGLLLYSFLGNKREGFESDVSLNSGVSVSTNNYDNYDHYSGSSSPTTYYGPEGGTAKIMNTSGVYSIVVTNSNGETTAYVMNSGSDGGTSGSSGSSGSDGGTSGSTTGGNSISSMMSQFANQTFYGPEGGSSRVFTGNDGQYAIEETQANGNTIIYTANNKYTYTYTQDENTNENSDYTPGNSNSYKNQYYDSSSSSSSSSSPTSASPYPSSPTTGNNYNNQYDSSMPSGISRNMIPSGQEDLYILKSEIVPPVCPACPSSSVCPRTEAPPPCPACERCPEPSFECKKVPNYSTISEDNLPNSVLNNYSTFGM